MDEDEDEDASVVPPLLISDLGSGGLAGFVFGANTVTAQECLDRMLFGLPGHHMKQLRGLVPGVTRLFLFNFSTRSLTGVFVATAAPAMNIEPHAWTSGAAQYGGAAEWTKFPAQVRVRMLYGYSGVLRDNTLGNILSVAQNTRGRMGGPKQYEFSLQVGQVAALVAAFDQQEQVRGARVGLKKKKQRKPRTAEQAEAHRKKHNLRHGKGRSKKQKNVNTAGGGEK